MTAAELPDPKDRTLAWWCGEPAYLAWFRAVEAAGSAREVDGWDMMALVNAYAHSVPTRDAVDQVAAHGPLIEVGAGAGYWARLLRDRGADVVAVDDDPTDGNPWRAAGPLWSEVRRGDESVLADYPDRTMFVCWPLRPGGFLPELLDTDLLEQLILITDGRRSIGIDRLYDRLDSGWDLSRRVALPNWPYRVDSLMFWRRR